MSEQRLFIGIPPDAETSANLVRLPQEATTPPTLTNWTPHPNLHLTLLFLGNIPDNLIHPISATCRSAAMEQSFSLPFDQYRLVLHKRNPSMIWAQYDLVPPFLKLVQALHHTCSNFLKLQPLHNPVVPHCTLARIKDGAKQDQFDLTTLPNGSPWRASQFCLYRSQLKPSGAEYAVLETFSLTSRQ